MEGYNPYDSPKAGINRDAFAREGNEGRGVWQDGDVLVMVKIANLPMRCVKCDEPATTKLKRNLSWHPPLIYLTVLAGLLVYVIIALVVRKQAKIQVPLCDRHRAIRVRAIWTAWLVVFTGIGLMVFGSGLDRDISAGVVILGVLTLFGGAVYGALRSSTVTPKKIDVTHVWLKGVCPAFLARFPMLPLASRDPDKLVFPEV